jgi:redox-sensitive bicupin YhaK (pirin superfamily)
VIRLRLAAERGAFRNDWLDARFTFSFGTYRDAAFDGYSDLWVLNDDRVAAGGGFDWHPHRNVEVMSYPLAGRVEHHDSLGNRVVLGPGDVHLMRAGTGIQHSEMNASASQPEHHLQWWIRPQRTGGAPGYWRLHVAREDKLNRLRLLAAPDGPAGVLPLAQDARVHAAIVDGAALDYAPRRGRRTYLHTARGRVAVNGHRLEAGDGAFVEDEARLRLENARGDEAEVVLFDLR